MRASILGGLLLVGVLAASCGHDRSEPDPHGDHAPAGRGHEAGERDAGAIHLDASERVRFGITAVPVGPGMVDLGIDLLGEVHPNGDRLAHITPRFPGIVREVRHTVGDTVHAGEVLAILESSESLAPYELKTLIDGTIIEKHLTRGEALDRETQAFVIADLSSVWVDLIVYQRDLARVRLAQPVRVRASSEGPASEGTIGYLTPGLDQTTRTARARVVLPNPDGRWRPGMFVTAVAIEDELAALVVPTSALQTIGGRPSVFVIHGESIRARAVSLGRQGDTTAEVLGGLMAGEQIVATNSFLLKAELAKGEAAHEH
jgi:cobalt-zinc-cadmium efflux system membrane fusion protein